MTRHDEDKSARLVILFSTGLCLLWMLAFLVLMLLPAPVVSIIELPVGR